MERGTFERTMKLFAATWPERAPTPDTAAAYWLALRHIDDEAFERAARLCLQQCVFYPKPSEVLERVRLVLEQAGALPASPEHAWLEVARVLAFERSAEGMYGRLGGDATPRPPLSNPQIERALVALGGARSMRDITLEEQGFRRREFLKLYGGYREQWLATDPEVLAAPLPLPTPAVAALEAGEPDPLGAIARLLQDEEEV